MESERTEEYLEAIYKRQIIKTPVSTSALAEDLKVSQPAVTDMLRHLKNAGLIDYRTSKGTVLTDIGTKRALKIIRKHRLWERFLTDILHVKWDKVHEEACKLEHVTSPEIENGLAGILGDVTTCPHGQPIPTKSGLIKKEDAKPLSSFKPLQQVCILAISNENPEFLREIDKVGIQIKTVIKILKRRMDGDFDVEIAKKRVRLSKEISEVLLAKPATLKKLREVEDEILLSKLGSGKSGIIKSYIGKRSTLGRYLSLGFTPGSVIKMLKNYNSGPVLVKIHDTDIAIGQELADKIIINRIEATC